MSARLLVPAALCCVALAAPASRVTETTLPLADPAARRFYFVGDMALAVDYDGGGKVTARINAYDLPKAAFAWRQEVRVQENGKNPGNFITTQASQNRVLLGNGPLTVMDVNTGRTLWALDCKTAGAVDLPRSTFLADGDLLLQGSEDCGDVENVRILRLNGATGAVRWQSDAEAHKYKTGNIEHRDFAWYAEGATRVSAASVSPDSASARDSSQIDALAGNTFVPAQVVVAGKRLAAIDYQSGRQNWFVKDEPGRWVPVSLRGQSLWVDDDKLFAYSTRDGARQWSYDLRAPWAIVAPVDTTDTGDLIAITWKNAHRIDRATGRAKWSIQREDDTWGQLLRPGFFLLTLKRKNYAAVDLATGQVKWTAKVESDAPRRRIDEELSPMQSGVVLVAGFEDERWGPWELNAIDAASGRALWSLDRINKKKIVNYWVIDATRLVARSEDQDVEIDVKTGAVLGAWKRRLRERYDSGERFFNGYRVWYTGDKKTLFCYGADGQVVWQRSGERSENARVDILAQGVVVWPTQDGKVELIDLATGTSLHSTTGNKKPYIGIDVDNGRVLVPQGKTIKLLAVGGAL